MRARASTGEAGDTTAIQMGMASKMKLQGKLENPGISGAQNCAKIGSVESGSGSVEISVIDNIERLKASLQSDPFAVRESAAQRCVELEIAGTNRRVSSEITKRPQRVRSERRPIQP